MVPELIEKKSEDEKEVIPEILENRYEYDKENRMLISALVRSKLKNILLNYMIDKDAKKLSDEFSTMMSKYTSKKLRYQFVTDGSSASLIPLDQKTKEIFRKLKI